MTSVSFRKFLNLPIFFLIGVIITIISVGILSIDSRDTVVLTFASIFQFSYSIFILIRLLWFFYILFNNYQRDDKSVNIISILDMYGSYLLSSIMISYSMWFLDLSSNRDVSFSDIGNTPAIDAYERIFSYTLLVIGTGGFGSVSPTSALTRVWSGLMITGSTLLSTIFIAAAISIILENISPFEKERKVRSNRVNRQLKNF